MKKLITIFALTLFVLIGCQSKPTIAPEEVLDETFQKRDEVENYYIESNMKLKIEGLGQKQSQTAIFKGGIDETNDEANIETVERVDNQETKANFIYKDGSQYAFSEGIWQKDVMQTENLKESGTTYYRIIEALKEFNEYATVKKEKDHYLATYDGSAEDVFYIFQDVFNMTLTGFDLEDETTIVVEAKIDEATLNLSNLLVHVLAESSAGKIDMSIDTAFTDINDTTIELPQEAIDATE